MKIINKIPLAMLLLTLLAACSILKNSAQSEKSNLTLSTPNSIKTFRLSDEIFVIAENNSVDKISIDPKDILLLMEKDDVWVSVDNLVDYSGAIYVLGPQDQKIENHDVIVVAPNIDIEEPTTVRIIVKGINLSTEKKVEAQIDINVSP